MRYNTHQITCLGTPGDGGGCSGEQRWPKKWTCYVPLERNVATAPRMRMRGPFSLLLTWTDRRARAAAATCRAYFCRKSRLRRGARRAVKMSARRKVRDGIGFDSITVGEEWERPSHYRVVSRRLMNGRNGLVTECVVDQLSSRLLANGGVSDGRRGAS